MHTGSEVDIALSAGDDEKVFGFRRVRARQRSGCDVAAEARDERARGGRVEARHCQEEAHRVAVPVKRQVRHLQIAVGHESGARRTGCGGRRTRRRTGLRRAVGEHTLD